MASHRRHNKRLALAAPDLGDDGRQNLIHAVDAAAAGCNGYPHPWPDHLADPWPTELLRNGRAHIKQPFRVVGKLHRRPRRDRHALQQVVEHVAGGGLVCAIVWHHCTFVFTTKAQRT